MAESNFDDGLETAAVVGVINALCGSFCSAAGYTAHKYAHNQIAAEPSRGPVSVSALFSPNSHSHVSDRPPNRRRRLCLSDAASYE